MAESTDTHLLRNLEAIVVASVAITARALVEVAPELTFVQWRVLVLIDQPGGMAVGAIASRLGGKVPAMSRLIGRLRERGLVATRRSEDDARVVLVAPTAAGAALRKRVGERRRLELRSAIATARLAPGGADVVNRLAVVLGELG